MADVDRGSSTNTCKSYCCDKEDFVGYKGSVGVVTMRRLYLYLSAQKVQRRISEEAPQNNGSDPWHLVIFELSIPGLAALDPSLRLRPARPPLSPLTKFYENRPSLNEIDNHSQNDKFQSPPNSAVKLIDPPVLFQQTTNSKCPHPQFACIMIAIRF